MSLEKAATKRRLSLAGKAMLGEATESTGGGGGGGEAPLEVGHFCAMTCCYDVFTR